MDENRLKHSLAVANKMIELNNGIDAQNLFPIGYLHDIDYQFTDDKKTHNIIGGEILKEQGFKYWKEIYYHGEPDCEYNSKYLFLLNKADMMIDNKGNDIGFDIRLENIKERYGIESIQYKKAKKLIQKLKEQENEFKN